MTVYGLMQVLTMACGPSASFGDVHVWWNERDQRLKLSKTKPWPDCECLDDLSLNARGELQRPVTPAERAQS